MGIEVVKEGVEREKDEIKIRKMGWEYVKRLMLGKKKRKEEEKRMIREKMDEEEWIRK